MTGVLHNYQEVVLSLQENLLLQEVFFPSLGQEELLPSPRASRQSGKTICGGSVNQRPNKIRPKEKVTFLSPGASVGRIATEKITAAC